MRFVLGLVFVFVAAVATLGALQSFAGGVNPRTAGQFTGGFLLALIFGGVGLKMMRQRVRSA